MVIADDEGDALEAALLEAGQELTPMHFGLTERGADAQNGALALRVDTQGDEDGAIHQAAAMADLFVAGIQDEIGKGTQGPGAPSLEFDIELGGALADLRGADRAAAKFLDDGGDFAGGDALHIHLGQGEFEGLLAADALLQRGGVELQAGTDLGDLEGDGPDPGGEGLGLEAVGLSLACGSALIGLGLEDGGAFAAHGFIDEEADALAEALVALLSEELQDGVQEIRVGLVGHVFLGGGCV